MRAIAEVTAENLESFARGGVAKYPVG
jgi:hypothetical protein